MDTTRLGIDIGGTGIKAGLVDVALGELVGDRVRVRTPTEPATVIATVGKLVAEMGYQGPIGIGFPSVIRDGRVWTANNIDPSWIGLEAVSLFSEATGTVVRMVNDADAAALCEARFGAAKGVDGVVLVVTFGTGIGSGLLKDGELVPNVEVGILELDGHIPAETYFCGNSKEDENLTWDQWGNRANRFLGHVARVFNPAQIVVGGGLVNHWDQWRDCLDPRLPVTPAARGNNAGLIGAATLVG
ncbi:MAG: ROK family protein [Actinobacteria bacterium]|nr:ROK family protein [Actinomycetota bacterium]